MNALILQFRPQADVIPTTRRAMFQGPSGRRVGEELLRDWGPFNIVVVYARYLTLAVIENISMDIRT